MFEKCPGLSWCHSSVKHVEKKKPAQTSESVTDFPGNTSLLRHGKIKPAQYSKTVVDFHGAMPSLKHVVKGGPCNVRNMSRAITGHVSICSAMLQSCRDKQ